MKQKVEKVPKIQKILAWSCLSMALLFVVLSLVILFAGSSLGPDMLRNLGWVAIGLLATSIFMAVSMLVMSLAP